MEMMMTFPLGIRFRPTDEELLVGYLQRKVLNLPLPCNVIKEIELYNYHPSEIGRPGEVVDNKSYFFTRTKGKRQNRIAKNGGHWKANSKTDVWDRKNKKIGTKRSLVFMSSEKKKSNWLMDEYKTDELNDWALCCIYEHINAEEKKKRKERAASSSIAQNIHSEGIDHDQSPLRKRREVEAVSKDEETPLYSDIFDQYEETSHCLDIFDQWKEEDAKLLQTSSEELSELLELKPPMQGIPSSTAQVCPSLGHPMSSITGENMNEGQTYGDEETPLYLDIFDQYEETSHCLDIFDQWKEEDAKLLQTFSEELSELLELKPPIQGIPSSTAQVCPSLGHPVSSITGENMNDGQTYGVDPSSFSGPDHIPSSISQGSSLWAPPGPHLTSPITGGDMNQGDPRAYAVGLSSSNGPDRIPSSILQGSSLWAPPGPHPTSSIAGGDVRPALW